jgi:hypothetical protein
MNDERISKKELLEQTGISYGQLYRWKRERLIPEEWFIKQSAFTGQETYFPREQVLTRVQAILSLKDTHSLEELASIFSPAPGSAIPTTFLTCFDSLNQELLALLLQEDTIRVSYETGEAVFLTALSRLIGTDGFDVNAAAELARATLGVDGGRISPSSSCTLFKPSADSPDFHVVFCQDVNPPLFDGKVAVIGTLALGETAELLGNFLQTINQKA